MSDGETAAAAMEMTDAEIDEMAAFSRDMLGRPKLSERKRLVAGLVVRLAAERDGRRAAEAENARLRAALLTVRGLLVMPPTRADGGDVYADPYDLQRVIDAALAKK